MSHPLITIGVLSWNRLNYLRATLESARLCIQYHDIEWIVSDNESEEPGLREYVGSCDWVTHRIFKRQTHADAMNQIVAMAKGDYLILWPEDVQFTVKGDWLADLVELLQKHDWLGSVGLDFLRKSTIENTFHPALWANRSRILDEIQCYGVSFRRQQLLRSSRGFGMRTFGWVRPGVCGSGIPTLTRTQVWRDMGPWKTTSRGQNAGNVIDSSLGAEDDMVERFYQSRRPLQMACLITPVAADIITDPTGCKAKVRGRYRYGVYTPPSGPFYYRISDLADYASYHGSTPINFTDGVEPVGFTIPLDENGDRLKSPINMSVVYDIQALPGGQASRDMSLPLTVLMPVYNGSAYLAKAMESVLLQSFGDFEFLIVDDCSTDDSVVVISQFRDPRIRLLHNEQRLKLAGALNRGMDEARGEYIARMDADDLCLPARLEEQVGFLKQHTEIGLCGTWVRTFDARTEELRYPVGSQRVRAFSLFNTPFGHPTVMFRREWFDRASLRYDVNFYPAEDYELWSRALAVFPADNLSRVLLKYRVHSQSMTGADWTNMDDQACRISSLLLKQMGMNASMEDLRLHRNIAQGRTDGSREFTGCAEDWLNKIVMANSQKSWCAPEDLRVVIEDAWFRLCLHSARSGGWVLGKYSGSRFATGGTGRWSRIFMLLLAVVKNGMLPSHAGQDHQ